MHSTKLRKLETQKPKVCWKTFTAKTPLFYSVPTQNHPFFLYLSVSTLGILIKVLSTLALTYDILTYSCKIFQPKYIVCPPPLLNIYTFLNSSLKAMAFSFPSLSTKELIPTKGWHSPQFSGPSCINQ